MAKVFSGGMLCVLKHYCENASLKFEKHRETKTFYFQRSPIFFEAKASDGGCEKSMPGNSMALELLVFQN